MNKDMIYHIFREAPKSRNMEIIKILKVYKQFWATCLFSGGAPLATGWGGRPPRAPRQDLWDLQNCWFYTGFISIFAWRWSMCCNGVCAGARFRCTGVRRERFWRFRDAHSPYDRRELHFQNHQKGIGFISKTCNCVWFRVPRCWFKVSSLIYGVRDGRSYPNMIQSSTHIPPR